VIYQLSNPIEFDGIKRGLVFGMRRQGAALPVRRAAEKLFRPA
jgi:hypothetical protein